MIPEASIQQAFGAPPVALDGYAGTEPTYLAGQFLEQQVTVVGVAAQIVDITASSKAASTPKFLDQGIALEIESRDDDCFVRFRPDNGVAGTTNGAASNGRKIIKNTPTVFWLPGPTFQFMDIISATAANHVAWRRISMPRTRG